MGRVPHATFTVENALRFIVVLKLELSSDKFFNRVINACFVGVDCVLQVGYKRHSRMTERRQVLPLQFRCEAGLVLCN